MKLDDFHRYASRTQLKARSLGIARAVLVDGVSIPQAARDAGVQYETARAAVARIVREYRSEGGYPPDWETRTLSLPRDDMERVAEIEDRALKKAGLRV